MNAAIGQRYTVLATEGLAIEFERQLRHNAALNRLRKIIDVQSGQAEPRNLEERLVRREKQLSLINIVVLKLRQDFINFSFIAADEKPS